MEDSSIEIIQSEENTERRESKGSPQKLGYKWEKQSMHYWTPRRKKESKGAVVYKEIMADKCPNHKHIWTSMVHEAHNSPKLSSQKDLFPYIL